MRTECIGDERADLRTGIIVSNLLLPHLKKGSKVSAINYMPYVVIRPPTPEQINSIIGSAIQGAKRGSKHR